MECKYVGTDLTVTQQQQEMVLVIGENIKVRRFARFAENVSVPYVHAGGKIGVLVNLESDLPAEKVEEIGKDVAMQIAALNPRFWDKSQVGQDVLDEEKKIMMVQMETDPKMASKPEAVREKIVMGKLNKFYSENCLLQQEFVKDNSMSQQRVWNSMCRAFVKCVAIHTGLGFDLWLKEEISNEPYIPDTLQKRASPAKIKTIQQLCISHGIDGDAWVAGNGKKWDELTEGEAAKMLNALKQRYGDE